MQRQRFGNAHPNSLYCTQIVADPKVRKRYRAWLRQIGGDVGAMNRWARSETTEPARFKR